MATLKEIEALTFADCPPAVQNFITTRISAVDKQDGSASTPQEHERTTNALVAMYQNWLIYEAGASQWTRVCLAYCKAHVTLYQGGDPGDDEEYALMELDRMRVIAPRYVKLHALMPEIVQGK